MKATILTLIFIAMLTGIIHTIIYSNFLVNLIIGFTIFLGFFGLHCMYESISHKDEKRRWLLLFMGATSVLIAYFSLEFAWRQRR